MTKAETECTKWNGDKEHGREFGADPVRNFCWQIDEADGQEPHGAGESELYLGQVILYKRNPDVVRYALDQANGKCGDCKQQAPFNRAGTDEPYLEVHHIIQLSKGGPDTRDNVIALCPNCHRRMHYG